MDSGERLKQMQKEKKLMELLAITKTKSNNSINSQENSNNKNTIFEIRKQLIQYRKTKAQEKNIPPCYVFTNEELDKMLVLKPRTYSDLSGANSARVSSIYDFTTSAIFPRYFLFTAIAPFLSWI